MKIELLLAQRYLWGRRLRSALTMLAIVFGVMIMFGMQGVIPAVRASFTGNLELAAHGVDLIVTRSDGQLFPQTVADSVATTPGVALVMPVLERALRLPAALALPAPSGEPIRTLLINGVDPASAAAAIPIAPSAGRWFGPGDDSRAILVRASLLEASGLALGDTLRLPAASGTLELTIIGVLPKRPVFGDEEIYLPLATAQQIFNLPGQINALTGQFAEGQDAELLRGQILEQLGPGYAAGAVEAGGSEWDSVLEIGAAAFMLFGGLALAMGGFIIFNTFRTGVAERQRDIGMLRAVGASRRTVVGIVVLESLLLGAAGTALGILAGYALVSGLVAAIGPTWARYFGAPLGAPTFGPAVWLISVGLGLGVPLLSGLIPALRAGQLSPLEALRPSGEAAAPKSSRARLGGLALLGLALLGLLSGEARLALLGSLLSLAGLIVLGPALVPPLARAGGRLLTLLFPQAGAIARGNLLRNPGRAAATASAMLISIAILVALGGLTSTFTRGLLGYLEQSMRADYMLVPEALILGQGNVGAGPELAERLRALPGVSAVTTLRQTTGRLNDNKAQLIGIDPATYPELAGLLFTGGEPAHAYQRLTAGGSIIVNGVLAAQLGLTVGDSVSLETPAGPQRYEIVGVGIDYLNSRLATAYLSQADLAAALGQQSDSLLMANRAPAAAQAELEQGLRDLVRDYPAFSVISFAQWRAEQLAGNQARTNILYGLMVALAIPSLIALANTLGINVLERTRELGVLRAIGATSGQIQRIIIAESLLLASLGVLGGLLAGVGLGYALVGAINRGGLSFAYSFPLGGLVLASVVGLLFGVLAALLPARRAARLNIIAALRWE